MSLSKNNNILMKNDNLYYLKNIKNINENNDSLLFLKEKSENIINHQQITNNSALLTNNGALLTNNGALLSNNGALLSNNGALLTNNKEEKNKFIIHNMDLFFNEQIIKIAKIANFFTILRSF